MRMQHHASRRTYFQPSVVLQHVHCMSATECTPVLSVLSSTGLIVTLILHHPVFVGSLSTNLRCSGFRHDMVCVGNTVALLQPIGLQGLGCAHAYMNISKELALQGGNPIPPLQLARQPDSTPLGQKCLQQRTV